MPSAGSCGERQGDEPQKQHQEFRIAEIVLEEPNRFACQVGFAHIPRHILGRDIVFSKYMLAFDERAQLIYYRESQG